MILAKEYYEHFSRSRYYGAILVFIAFSLMVTGLIPLEIVLLPCIATDPNHWKKIASYCVLGSSLGALILAALFTVYGRAFVEHFFPLLPSSRQFLQMEQWIDNVGVFALAGIAALPIAQLPAIAFCGLMKMNLGQIFVSFLIGKSAKYGLIAYGASRAELKIQRFRNAAKLSQ